MALAAAGRARPVRADRARLRGADLGLRRLRLLGARTSSQNSHSAKPLLYKVTGAWGNHEGSMVLWVLILALFGARGGRCSAATCRRRLQARVLAVQGMIGVGFLAFILFTSNPFLRLDPAPLDGHGPQPAAAGPRPRLPPAVPLPRLCRLLDGLLLRRRRADRGPGRRRLGALGAALDAGRLVRPDHRHRARLLVGLLRARLGRLVVLGPGRERLASCPGWPAPRCCTRRSWSRSATR